MGRSGISPTQTHTLFADSRALRVSLLALLAVTVGGCSNDIAPQPEGAGQGEHEGAGQGEQERATRHCDTTATLDVLDLARPAARQSFILERRRARHCPSRVVGRSSTRGRQVLAQLPPSVSSASGLVFATSEIGWAFGPGLAETSDAGASWQEVGTPDRSVLAGAARDGSVALLARADCRPRRVRCPGVLRVSHDAGQSWRSYPVKSMDWQADVDVGRGTAIAFLGKRSLRIDRGGDAKRLRSPCQVAGVASGGEVAIDDRGTSWMVCESAPLRPLRKPIYSIGNDDEAWRRRRVQRVQRGALTEKAGDLAAYGNGQLVLSQYRGAVAYSPDQGRSWRTAVDDDLAVADPSTGTVACPPKGACWAHTTQSHIFVQQKRGRWRPLRR